MTEIPAASPDNTRQEQSAQSDATNAGFGNEVLPEKRYTAEELRAAQIGWLQRRDLLQNTPHLTMTNREFELWRNAGLSDGDNDASSLIDQTKEAYGIPPSTQYVSVDIVHDDASLPATPTLVAVAKWDFGTKVDEGRLDRQEIEANGIPHITMTEREFRLFGIVGHTDDSTAPLIHYVRGLYGIPQADQEAPQYALIDVASDDPNLPSDPLLVKINEVDFGTVIDREAIYNDNKYLKHGPGPTSPLTPETGAYHAVNISETLSDTWDELRTFARELMAGRTESPLTGNFWLRAGGLMPGQGAAYVWENGRELTNALEAAINSPDSYPSVCAVVGERHDAANGKRGMAQIHNPTVIFTIEGDNLTRLKEIYRKLYHEPNFVLTPEQREQRDEMLNNYLFGLISEAARENRDRADDANRIVQPLQQRYHQHP